METDYMNQVHKVLNQPPKTVTAVKMLTVHHENGLCIPLWLKWNDGRKFKVDEVLEVKPNGINNIIYKVKIRGKQRVLYLRQNKWYVEKKG